MQVLYRPKQIFLLHLGVIERLPRAPWLGSSVALGSELPEKLPIKEIRVWLISAGPWIFNQRAIFDLVLDSGKIHSGCRARRLDGEGADRACVRDFGTWLPADNPERVFDGFFRLSAMGPTSVAELVILA